MKLDLILENVRNKYSLGLLEESEGLDEKTILQGKILINESSMKIRSMLVEEGTMDSVKALLEEAWTATLLEEEMSQMAKNGMKLGGAAAGLGMAHAGAFGGGIKGMVDGAGSAVANGAGRAGAHAGDAFKHTAGFYKNDEGPNPHAEKAAHAEKVASHQAQADHSVEDAGDAGDDEDGLGVLGTIGAGTLAAGAGYLGLKGAKAANNSRAAGDFREGNRGVSHSNAGLAHKLGSSMRTGRQRSNNAFNALRGK